MHDDRSHDDLGIGVMDVAALSADVSFHRVAVRYATTEMRTGRRGKRSALIAHRRNCAQTWRSRKECRSIKFDATSSRNMHRSCCGGAIACLIFPSTAVPEWGR